VRRASLLFAAWLLPACFGKVEPEPSACPSSPPTCVTPSVSCGMPALVDAVCDARDHTWSCPAGATVHARAAATATCLPFAGAAGPFESLGGSLARVPVDGGRCLWIAETATSSSGSSLRNVGLIAPPTPFGTCPATSGFGGGEPTPVVEVSGAADPTLLVQIDGGFLDGGQTRVVYRLFRTDATATFGVTLLGGGFGRWDSQAQRIVVPGAESLLWDPSIDPGDASLVVAGVPYVWGCHSPAEFLTYPCALAKVDGDALEYLTPSGSWLADAGVSATATVFQSGPWIASVLPSAAGGFLHVYADGFGTTLESDTSAAVAGPWSAGPTLAACDLPAADAHAFCAGPVVHEELMDPTLPGELVVSYGVGTTGSPTATTGTLSTSYWTRLVWVAAGGS